MRTFDVPITVTLRVSLDDDGGMTSDEARQAAHIVGAVVAQRIEETTIPNPGDVRVQRTEVGYPTDLGRRGDMSLYLWKVCVTPNARWHHVVASSIESACALALNGGTGRVISAEQVIEINRVEQVDQKGHPYR